jgi:uncharacterized membrane protein YeaQ/YmgE (transglycosylase-associated protein family)
MEGRGFGLMGNIIIGIIGAIAGGLLFGLLGLIGSIVTAIAGAALYYFWLGLSRSLRINPELIHQGDDYELERSI